MNSVHTMRDLNTDTAVDVKVGRTFTSEAEGLYALFSLMFDHWAPLCDITGLSREVAPRAAGYSVEWLLYKQSGSYGIVRGQWKAPPTGLPSGMASVRWPDGAVVLAHTHPLMDDDFKYESDEMFFARPVSHNVLWGDYNQGVQRAMPSYGDLDATQPPGAQWVVAPYVYVPPEKTVAKEQGDISPVQIARQVTDAQAHRTRLDALRGRFMQDRVFLCASRWSGKRVNGTESTTDLEFLGVSHEVRWAAVRGKLTIKRINAGNESYAFVEEPW
jgi:hypothetical protein